MAQRRFKALLGLFFDRVDRPFGAVTRLFGIEQDLALRLDRFARRVFGGLQPVEPGGARHEFGILAGRGSGGTGGDPIVEGFAAAAIGLAGGLGLQIGLFECGARRGDAGIGGRTFGAQRADGGLVDEIFADDAAIDLGQIADNDIAEPDEEKRKDQRDQPQAAVEPFFGKAQRFAHCGTVPLWKHRVNSAAGVAAIPIDEARNPGCQRGRRVIAQIATRRADIGPGGSDIAGLHRQ